MSFKWFEMTEERLDVAEAHYRAINVIQMLITLDCPKDPSELSGWLRKVDVLQKLLSKFWGVDVTGKIMVVCLNILYDIISGNESTVSPAVWCALDLVDRERINGIVERILCDTSGNPDLRVRNALVAIVDGLCQYGPRAPRLQFWALSIIQSLQIRRNFAILTSVAEATIVNLGLGFLMNLYRPLIYPIYRLFLYSATTPVIFQKVLDKSLRAMIELEKKGDEEALICLIDFSALLRILLLRFPPEPHQEAEYNAIRALVSRQPDVEFEPIALTLWRLEQNRNLCELGISPLMLGLEITPPGPHKGLVNMGNTCFLNSVLQVLYMTTRFRREILQKEVDPTERAAADLQQLFAFMRDSNRTVLVPNAVMESTLPPIFRRGYQQDSSEYLIHLLDTLHENESRVMQRRKLAISIQRAIERSQEGYSDSTEEGSYSDAINDEENTIVDRLFGGVLTTTIICSFCKKAFPKNDSFRDLHLPLPDEHRERDLQDLIDASLEPEELCNENMYDCSNCGTKRDATRRQTVVQAPEHLILTLKSFRFDPMRNQRLKLQTRLRTADTVEIPVYNSSQTRIKQVTYEVKGVVFHSGVSIDGGHYFSCAMNEAGTWYLFNDSLVTQLKYEWNTGFATPYIIVLRQRNITDPPKYLLPVYLRNMVIRDNQKYMIDKKYRQRRIIYNKDFEDDYDGPPPGNGSLGGPGSSLVF